jgi:hypothetical protein
MKGGQLYGAEKNLFFFKETVTLYEMTNINFKGSIYWKTVVSNSSILLRGKQTADIKKPNQF